MNSKPFLNTVLSPRLLDLYDISNCVVVIIDVFRATSTIATALYNGAAKVIPVDSVPRCIELGKITGGITAGERDGKVVEGLQHGNSPAEYPRSFIEGQTLVLTTTNGTKLLHMALERGASEVITGSFPNLSTVCDHLVHSGKNVILGCSAWKDKFNLEDTLFAGAVIQRIKEHFTIHCDSSLMAENMYALHQNDMPSFIRKTTHWHRLAAYGMEKDLDYCVSIDVANVLPVYTNGALLVNPQ
ncbi:2-phosphosulfolactate phosphatase [Filimonas lacunae]|uniref:Probable 2-phosphosulfolactate phosphatase n=1 Tax=Filimonas lacunae TaxID=477680 RepID=A0A173MPN5_9BACT|nr:2-phosphosulfolactate phosphatase [Filimonas lacunae]BAV09633.1 2-phosphosulfolactate phosphatase [Filimonas lacunae]SIS76239.1 2-phosphosulfolactate phosphatase [Filimonas lacunae]